MRQTILFVAAMLVSSLAFGQWELKPTVGINFTDVSKNPDNGEVQGRTGWQFGASAIFGRKFYVEPGVLYVKKSTEFTENTTNPDIFNTDLSGLRIPVAVGYHLLGSEETTAALRVYGGASAFILTSVDTEGLDKDDFESPTWGVFAGAGLDIWILFLDLQYEWSLTDVTSVTQFDLGKSRSFFLNAGIRLAF